MEQYAVDFGRTADRIQMNAPSPSPCQHRGVDLEQRLVCIACPERKIVWQMII